MLAHNLFKTERTWHCESCKWQWRGKPRTACPGLPRYDWSTVPQNLLLEADFKYHNFKKPDGVKPVGCVYHQSQGAFIWLYDRAHLHQVSELPTIYTWNTRPPDLMTAQKLGKFNLKPGEDTKPHGCVWHGTQEKWIFLYRKEECVIDDPSLPQCYEYADKPEELKTRKQVEKMGLRPKENTKPRGCFMVFEDGEWLPILLYHPDDCEWDVDQDKFITKTSLKQTYLLSDRWIARLGEPDATVENPHHRKWSEMCLYSRKRVENFLANNAHEYAKWLSDRDRHVAHFFLHHEAIRAGQQRSIIERREQRQREIEAARAQRQAELNQHIEAQRLQLQYGQSATIAKQWNMDISDAAIHQQLINCLRCSFSEIFGGGFLCTAHPLGLQDYEIPCPDYEPRNDASADSP